MNLLHYIDSYGCYSFKDVEFNEVDNAILSSLSYLDLEGIVSSNRFSPITVREAAELFFQKHLKKDNVLISIKNAIKVFKAIKGTKRYGDLLLYNYIYEKDEEGQFSALTIEIQPKLVFVSFEGTDDTVGGWKEDFMFCYTFPTMGQKKAIDYVNKRFMFRNKKIILGGHSKGGHLAIIAGMYANFLVRDKIINIYNNDGPGVLKEQIDSGYYKNIEKKLIHIVPNHSVFGLLLYHKDNYIVVRSAKKGLWAHDMFTWVVQDKQFMRAELDSFSSSLEKTILEWLEKCDINKKEKFVTSLFDIFKRVGVDNISDILENKKLVFDLITEAKDLDSDDRKILKDLFQIILKCFADEKKEEIMSLFGRK